MKIAGLPILGIILATLCYYIFEFVWYSFLFQDAWQAGSSVTPDDYLGQSGSWMALGFLAPLLQVIAISLILKWAGWPSMGDALAKILCLAILIGSGVGLYALVYLPQHSLSLFFIDTAHYLIGWLMSAFILTHFRPKYIAPVKHRQSKEDVEDIYS